MATHSVLPVRFGTSGWRGILGDEVTDERLRALVHGSVPWLRAQLRSPRGRTRVLVGFDSRFASERLACIAAELLAARGLSPALSEGCTPTPAIAREVPRRRAAGALVLTASHNPPDYHGLKLFGARGEPIGDRAAARVERATARALGRVPRSVARPSRISRADFAGAYAEALIDSLEGPRIRAAHPRVVYDAMHGVGAGVLDHALIRSGARVDVLRADRDPRFGGVAPDPSAERLRELGRRVRAGRGLRLGLATDGDADRIAAVDERGRVLGEGAVAALLLDHLARSGRVQTGVALTPGCSSLLDRVAAAHALDVIRCPIGFKHLSRVLISGRAEFAVDESGGAALASFGLDKDGMLAGALLVELVATRRLGLGALLAELEARHGRVHARRTAVPSTPALEDGLRRLGEAPPRRLAGARVVAVSDLDGLRFELPDGFLMLRVSGTEPVLRVYAEARRAVDLDRRLQQGLALLRRASR